jgi:hypothetical protein
MTAEEPFKHHVIARHEAISRLYRVNPHGWPAYVEIATSFLLAMTRGEGPF